MKPMHHTYEAGQRVMAPFRQIIQHGGVDRRTIFGNDTYRIGEVLPRHTGRIGNPLPNGKDHEWLEPLAPAPTEDKHGHYLVRCLVYGTVVLAHRRELSDAGVVEAKPQKTRRKCVQTLS